MQTLEEVRTSRGVTKTAAMRAMDVSRPTYDRYEEDPGLIPVGKYLALCEFLHVDPGDIFLPGASNQIHRKEAIV